MTFDGLTHVKTLRMIARGLIQISNQRDPDQRKFVLFEVTDMTQEKWQKVEAIFEAQQTKMDALKDQVKTLTAQVVDLTASQTASPVETAVDQFIASNEVLLNP